MKRSRFAVPGLLAAVVFAGCQWGEEEESFSGVAPPPAAIIAPVDGDAPLVEKLERLETELDAALTGELDEQAMARLYRAEAVTDRLLESDLPFAWLDEDYSLETRLKQVQAMADRVLAGLRRGVRPEILMADILRLRENVGRLREAVEAGSGRTAPPPLDSLLRTGG